jgi:hypothetical protein
MVTPQYLCAQAARGAVAGLPHKRRTFPSIGDLNVVTMANSTLGSMPRCLLALLVHIERRQTYLERGLALNFRSGIGPFEGILAPAPFSVHLTCVFFAPSKCALAELTNLLRQKKCRLREAGGNRGLPHVVLL